MPCWFGILRRHHAVVQERKGGKKSNEGNKQTKNYTIEAKGRNKITGSHSVIRTAEGLLDCVVE